ncbi:MAG: hypothetical protein AAF449_08235 [Myxococcota bacterium]
MAISIQITSRGFSMAITIVGSNEPKYVATYAYPMTDADEARFEVARAWREDNDGLIRTAWYTKPYPEDCIVKAVQITKGKKLYAWSDYVAGGGGGGILCQSGLQERRRIH